MKKIGLGSLGDGYGLAVFGGKVYVADAAANAVKVYEPAIDLLNPIATIAHGFVSLVDGALAVDPTNGHLLVVDNMQPGYEAPRGRRPRVRLLWSLPRVVAAARSRWPADRTGGRRTLGDRCRPEQRQSLRHRRQRRTLERLRIRAIRRFGPCGGAARRRLGLGLADRLDGTAVGGWGSWLASGLGIGGRPAGGRSRSASTVELTPNALPRHGQAPVGIAVDAEIAGTGGDAPPQLRKLAIAINRHGHFSADGLPVCRVQEIQPSTTGGALAACGDALVGEGHFSANVKLPRQSPFPSEGKVLAFNGRVRGKPAILAHIYGTQPAPTSYVLPFLIGRSRGTYGSVLEASLPQATGDWGYVTGLRMKLRRSFRYRGRTRSYLSAGCPAPAGFPSAVFPLARTSFSFAGGMELVSVLSRTCKAKD